MLFFSTDHFSSRIKRGQGRGDDFPPSPLVAFANANCCKTSATPSLRSVGSPTWLSCSGGPPIVTFVDQLFSLQLLADVVKVGLALGADSTFLALPFHALVVRPSCPASRSSESMLCWFLVSSGSEAAALLFRFIWQHDERRDWIPVRIGPEVDHLKPGENLDTLGHVFSQFNGYHHLAVTNAPHRELHLDRTA